MRQAQHASVLPYLYISINSTEQQGVRLLLSNSGIGPALVDEVHVRYQGRDFMSDPLDFILAQRPDIAKMGLKECKLQDELRCLDPRSGGGSLISTVITGGRCGASRDEP